MAATQSYASVPRGTPTIDTEDKTKMSAIERRRQQNRIAQRRCREKNQRKREAEKQAQQATRRQQEQTPQPHADSVCNSSRSSSDSSTEGMQAFMQSSTPIGFDLQPSSSNQSSSLGDAFAALTAADFELPNSLANTGAMDITSQFSMLSPPHTKSVSSTDLTSTWMSTPPERQSIDPADLTNFTSTQAMGAVPNQSTLPFSSTLDAHLTGTRSLTSSPASGLRHRNTLPSNGAPPQTRQARSRQRSSSLGPARHTRSSSASLHGNTALHTAVAQGQLGMAQTLLTQGANPSAVNSRGQTALHLAAQAGTLPCVRMLIPLCAFVDAKDFLGYTPLQLAVTRGHSQVVMALLESGADINAKIEEGPAPNLGGPMHSLSGWPDFGSAANGLANITSVPVGAESLASF